MKKWLLVLAFAVPLAAGCSESESVTPIWGVCDDNLDCDVGQECSAHTCVKGEGCWALWACVDGTDCSKEMVCHKKAGSCESGKCGRMVKVPAGTFTMGCADDDAGCLSFAKPAHDVTFAADFFIDSTEVTVEQYASCVAEGQFDKDGRLTKDSRTGLVACDRPNLDAGSCNWQGRRDFPVVCVDWNQANRFCKWNGKRLCTEAEWEYAARGTDGRIYPWGNEEPSCEKTNIIDVTPTSDVAGCDGDLTMFARPDDPETPDKSPFGAWYMAGNAWEWVQDFFHDSYVKAPVDGSEWKLDVGGRKTARGGRPDFDKVTDVRVDRRFAEFPPFQADTLGFRCCADEDPSRQ